jgi:ferredoxin
MVLPTLLNCVDSQTRVYACGPERLINELETMSERWPAQVLHYELFNGDGVVLDPLQEKAFVAVLKDSKIEVHVPSNLTLLKALQSAGFDVPCDCAEGLCGTCEVSVVEGVVDHRDKVLSKAERLQNQRMMSCCSRAIGPTITIAL